MKSLLFCMAVLGSTFSYGQTMPIRIPQPSTYRSPPPAPEPAKSCIDQGISVLNELVLSKEAEVDAKCTYKLSNSFVPRFSVVLICTPNGNADERVFAYRFSCLGGKIRVFEKPWMNR